MLEYDVVYANQIDELVEEVNRRLQEGWSLVGGLCLEKPWYYQAMTRMKSDV